MSQDQKEKLYVVLKNGQRVSGAIPLSEAEAEANKLRARLTEGKENATVTVVQYLTE